MLLEGYERNKSKLELLEIWSLKKVSRPSNQSRNNFFLLYFSFLLSLSLMFARKPQRSKFCLFAKKSIFDAEVVRSNFFGTAPIFFSDFSVFRIFVNDRRRQMAEMVGPERWKIGRKKLAFVWLRLILFYFFWPRLAKWFSSCWTYWIGYLVSFWLVK